jgi:hypothetical protein
MLGSKCLVLAALSILAWHAPAAELPAEGLRVVIIRHGEKQLDGENLTCQGENRARQLPLILYGKFGKPGAAYVPSLQSGNVTSHARMFQTISPFAIRYGLSINSQFAGNDYANLVKSILANKGTVLLVWNHTYIPALAAKLGVSQAPRWPDDDYDSVWIITYPEGKARLSIDREGLRPSAECHE